MRKFVGLRSQMYSYLKVRKNICNKARTQIRR